jgi:DNA-binding transcriptional ArsR family regulator
MPTGSDNTARQLDGTLAALADPTRRAVVDLLRTRPMRAGELARAFRVSPPAMSRHLRVLRRRGLVEEERMDDDARVRVYRLRPERFRDLQAWLREVESFWTDQLGAFKTFAEGRAPAAAEAEPTNADEVGVITPVDGERK